MHRLLMIRVLFLAAVFLSVEPAMAADWTQACYTIIAPEFSIDDLRENKRQRQEYCIYRERGSQNQDVVYFFHGLGEDARGWKDGNSFRRMIQDYWRDQKRDAPTIVAISFGKLWLLAERNSSRYSGLLEYVRDDLIPQIEKRLDQQIEQRLVMGFSMGGFNALQLVYKSDLFDKAALVCTEMAEVTPYDSWGKIMRYAKSTEAWRHHRKRFTHFLVVGAAAAMIYAVKKFYPKRREFQVADPLELMELNPRHELPEIYLSAGLHDQFFSYDGNKLFAETLQAQGERVQWHPVFGGHCKFDVPSLAEFLVSP